MKVVRKTGLVPVYSSSYAKRVFGVTPSIAFEGVQSGELVLVDIPSDVETYEYIAPEPEKVEAEVVDEGVEIPENWAELHHLQKIKIAKEIDEDFTVPEGMKSADYAEEVIEAEIQRRAAGE